MMEEEDDQISLSDGVLLDYDNEDDIIQKYL